MQQITSLLLFHSLVYVLDAYWIESYIPAFCSPLLNSALNNLGFSALVN